MVENTLTEIKPEASGDDLPATETESENEGAKRSYYYDDACGYEVYTDDEDESAES